jgi:predicted permease
MILVKLLARIRGAVGLLTGFTSERTHEQDLDDEMQFHLEKAVERNVRRGMTADQARRAALVQFGGRVQWTEAARDERRSRPLDDFARDFRYGAATLRRNPGFAVSAILTIALGITATVTVFSFINSIYLRPLAVPEGKRLVRIYGGDRPEFEQELGFPAYRELRRSARSLDMVAAHYSTAPLYLTSRGESAEARGAVVSADYFRMTGIRPALGRFFTPAEDSVPDRDAVAVIGYGLWQSRFGGEPRVIGETVTINGRAFSIIGVAQEGFDGVVAGFPSELWIPTMMLGTGYRWCNAFESTCAITSIIARLAPGATLAQARAEISALTPRLAALTDPSDSLHSIATTPATGVRVVSQRQFNQLSALLSAIALILMSVACANLSGLLLARGLSRQREIALRTSLGAGRGRIVRQLLTESAIIAGVGSAIGVLLSVWTSRSLVGFFATDNEGYLHRYDVSLDVRVALFAVVAAIAAVMLFGLFPALRTSRVDIAEALKIGSGGGATRGRARVALVAGQVALALSLLIGAGLLARSFGSVMSSQQFDPRHVAQLRLRPLLMGYDHERAVPYLHRALESIKSVPGVISAAPVRGSLVSQVTGRVTVALPGDVPVAKENATQVEYFDVGPDYFATLKVSVLAGREFSEHDGPSTPLVAMVNESLAKRLWPQGNVIGQPVLLNGKEFHVVGLVKDHRVHTMSEAPPAMAYVAFWQNTIVPQIDARIAIRVADDPLRALNALRRAASTADPRVPVTELLGMEAQMRATFTELRVGGAVLIVGASLALFLSAVGLYGVVSFLVTQRTREIGIRLAIGARPANVLAMLLRQGFHPVWIGGVIGVAASVAAAPLLSKWLFGIAPVDWLTMVGATGAVGLVAMLASYLPARRAARTDPAAVFRCD